MSIITLVFFSYMISSVVIYFHLPIWLTYLLGIILARIVARRDIALIKSMLERK